MNLRTGKVKNYSDKILISPPSFNIGTNLEVNLNERKDIPDVKQKKEPDIKSNKKTQTSELRGGNICPQVQRVFKSPGKIGLIKQSM